ncbi:MAG: phospho-sugar mutase [Clostridia bacterium]|nr:phospho-sugar mutase [Clostridia bacterium]
MSTIREEYGRWCRLVKDTELAGELSTLADAPDALEDAFYRPLVFGTGGLRGILGAGTNRMNLYTVRRATIGLADYLRERDTGEKRVAIGYDTRINSRLFAEVAATTLAARGIRVHLYDAPLPTPLLSFAVRELACDAGIMITASHNPSHYNGYKVYGADGSQITEQTASDILSHINAADYFESASPFSFAEGLARGSISYVPQEIYRRFIEKIGSLSMRFGDKADKTVSIVYTPLNGTGYVPVTEVLRQNGYRNLTVVKEQAEPDGTFPTCPSPNPELPEALSLGLSYAKQLQADLLLATDPDCDRVGVAVREGDDYRLLSGNEVGVLLLDYVAAQRVRHGRMPGSPIAVKTIVTTKLAEQVARKYGIGLINVLTGFKYIGETICNLEKKSESNRYIFGFEESCGYLSDTHVRDKDGVNAAYLIAEMCAFYKAQGLGLAERLEEIYREFGYMQNSLFSYSFPGAKGFEKMQSIMSRLRSGIDAFGRFSVTDVTDYRCGINELPKSDVLQFKLSEGCSFVIRPSGTEPKIKIYTSVRAENKKAASELTSCLRCSIEKSFR